MSNPRTYKRKLRDLPLSDALPPDVAGVALLERFCLWVGAQMPGHIAGLLSPAPTAHQTCRLLANTNPPGVASAGQDLQLGPQLYPWLLAAQGRYPTNALPQLPTAWTQWLPAPQPTDHVLLLRFEYHGQVQPLPVGLLWIQGPEAILPPAVENAIREQTPRLAAELQIYLMGERQQKYVTDLENRAAERLLDYTKANQALQKALADNQYITQALLRNEARLEHALSAGRIMVWEYDCRQAQLLSCTPTLSPRVLDEISAIIRETHQLLKQPKMNWPEELTQHTSPDGNVQYQLEHWLTVFGNTPTRMVSRWQVMPAKFGMPDVILGTSEDITALFEARHQLALTNAKLEAQVNRQVEEILQTRTQFEYILDSLKDAFAATDRNLCVQYVNQSFLRTFGLAHLQTIIGKPLQTLAPLFAQPNLQLLYQDALQSRSRSVMEEYLPGERKWFECVVYPYKCGLAVFIQDISGRKEAEQSLIRSEKHLNGIIRHAYDGVLLLNNAWEATFASPAALRMLGLRGQPWLGVPATQWFDGPSQQRLRSLEQEPDFQEGKPQQLELQTQITAHPLTLEVTITRVEEDELDFRYILNLRDITERKATLLELQKLQAAINHTQDGLVLLTPLPNNGQGKSKNRKQETVEPTILYVNPAFEALNQYPAQMLLGQTLRRLFASPKSSKLYEQLLHSMRRHRPCYAEAEATTANGQLLPSDWNLAPIFGPNGHDECLGYVAIQRDITRFKVLEERLSKQRQAQQLAVLNAIVETQERERRRFAEDLHDDIGHHLSALRMNLSTLQFDPQDPTQQLPESINQLLEGLLAMLDDAITASRNLARNLMPHVLYDFGLLPALRKLIAETENATQLKVNLVAQGLDERLPQSVEIALYRIVQELLNNAMKHAAATQIELEIARKEQKVYLNIQDNGKGFDPQQQSGKVQGMGLRNIESRVRIYNGKFQISAEPGQGARFQIELLLP